MLGRASPWWSGGGSLGSGGEGDGLAGELFELTGEVALVALLVAVGLVEVGAEVVVAGLGVGEQVVDDGQDRVADGDDGAFLAAASGQAPVAFAEEGVWCGRRRRRSRPGCRPARGCPCRWWRFSPCRPRCWPGVRTWPTRPGG